MNFQLIGTIDAKSDHITLLIMNDVMVSVGKAERINREFLDQIMNTLDKMKRYERKNIIFNIGLFNHRTSIKPFFC